MKTPPRRKQDFARFAHQVASSPFGGPERGASRETDRTAMNHVQNQLIAHGYLSKPLELGSAWSDEQAARLERCLNSMLAKAADDTAHQTHLMGKYRNLVNEYERLESQVGRDRQTLAISEQEKEAAKVKAAAATKELATEVSRHALSKDEATKARLALQTVKTTALHESKRREAELASALSRWQKLSSSPLGTAACIALNPSVPVERGVNSLQRERPSEVALLEQSLKELDEARVVVQEENVQLREVIGDVANEVRATLLALGQEMPSLAEDIEEDLISVVNPHLSLSPDALTNHLSKLFLSLREAALEADEAARRVADEQRQQADVQQEEQAKLVELEESLAAMQADLDEARAQLHEAQAAHEAHDAREAQANLDASAERTSLTHERRALEAERRKFTQAAAVLERERAFFEKERLEEMEARRKRRERKQQQQQREAGLGSLDATSDPQTNLREEDRPRAHKRSEDAPLASRAPSDVIQPKPARLDPQVDRIARKPSRNNLKASTTSTALLHILAAGSDTPPAARPLLAAKPTVPQATAAVREDAGRVKAKAKAQERVREGKVEGEKSEEKQIRKAPSSAALAARERVQRAVSAARARSSEGS